MPDERTVAVSRTTRPLRLARSILVITWLALSAERGGAVSNITLEVGDLQGEGWSARDVGVALELPGAGQIIARVRLALVTLTPELGPLRDVQVTCRNPVIKEPVFRCERAEVSGELGRLGPQRFTAEIAYHSERAALSVAADGLRLAQGQARIAGTWLEAGWTVAANLQNARLAELRKLAAPWFAMPEDFSVDGESSFRATISGGARIEQVHVDGTLSEVTASNSAGTFATDKLALHFDADLKPVDADWDLRASISSSSGQAYSDPVFLDFGQNAAAASVAGRWLADRNRLQIARLDLDQKDIVAGRLAGELDLAGETLLSRVRVDLDRLEFPGAFASLMLPFLLDTDLKDLQTGGRVSGVVEVEAGQPAELDLTLENVDAEGVAITLRSLRGRLRWRSSARLAAQAEGGLESPDTEVSRLEWKSSALYGISGGAARLDFVTSGADFRLLQPTVVPILDGGLAIRTLSIRELGDPRMSVRFEGELQPLSVALLCKAFGWPEFSGKLAGRIPQVSLEEDVLSLGGDLEASVFDGQVVVDALKLQNPLGDYPRLSANITMRNLDLEAVTGTFSFGTITGRLNADIRDLELFRWAPVRFDARLYTPPRDRSRHLISQRAVKNLSNIGGGGAGVTAALSSGFLRFFDNFRYDRLGLSCRLENEICLMDGIERQQGEAYYIVKGRGLPRIDIIGNAHRVSWSRLVSQLVAITESGGPVVQ